MSAVLTDVELAELRSNIECELREHSGDGPAMAVLPAAVVLRLIETIETERGRSRVAPRRPGARAPRRGGTCPA
ncbi:MAG: hypothetical protein IT379_39515 [Deltaproteobacteria bacterium]|nr:hypothetical protein [Deltaproteobacteria bacterium]